MTIARNCILVNVCFGRANRRTKKKVFKAKEKTRHLTPSQPRYKTQKIKAGLQTRDTKCYFS